MQWLKTANTFRSRKGKPLEGYSQHRLVSKYALLHFFPKTITMLYCDNVLSDVLRPNWSHFCPFSAGLSSDSMEGQTSIAVLWDCVMVHSIYSKVDFWWWCTIYIYMQTIHYITLNYIALRYIIHITLHYITLRYVTLHYITYIYIYYYIYTYYICICITIK